MRLVLDAAAFVAALRSDAGASRRLLIASIEGRVRPLASVPLLIEYEAVATRAEHPEHAGLSAADVGAILDAVAAVALPVRLAFLWRPVLRDADDDMVLETAVNGQADVIATFNVRDFEGAAKGLGLRILSPGQALAEIERQ